MAYDYDALYRTTPDALGAPSGVFVDFFDAHGDAPLRVLDIGCGQGRDALFIARLGHSVVGVDLSPSGVADMLAAATDLSVTGIVADLCDYTPECTFDVVLIDRTLHMMDVVPRHALLTRLAACVPSKGWVLIADEASNMAGFRTVLAGWDTRLKTKGAMFFQRP